MKADFTVELAFLRGSISAAYDEPGRGRHVFSGEFGGGKTVAVLYAPSTAAWDAALPWAAGRRREILERVAHEAIRRKAPGCRFTVHEGGIDIEECRGALRL